MDASYRNYKCPQFFPRMLKGKCALSVQVAVKAIKNAPHACVRRMSEHAMTHCAETVL